MSGATRLREEVARLESWQQRWDDARHRIEGLRDRGRVAVHVSRSVQEEIQEGDLGPYAPLVPSLIDVLLDVGVRPSSLSPDTVRALVGAYGDYHAAHRTWADGTGSSAAQREEDRSRRRDAARRFVAECGGALPAFDRQGDFDTRLLYRLGERGV